jgi:hypothetical protein
LIPVFGIGSDQERRKKKRMIKTNQSDQKNLHMDARERADPGASRGVRSYK